MTLPILVNLSPLIALVVIWALMIRQRGGKLPQPSGTPDSGAGPWISTLLLVVGLVNLYKPWLHLPHERARLLTIGLFMILIPGAALLRTLRGTSPRTWGQYSNFCMSAMLCSLAISAVLQP